MGEHKFLLEEYEVTAADAAAAIYIQRNFTPCGIQHGIDGSPGRCDSPQKWRVKSLEVTLQDSASYYILGAQIKILTLGLTQSSGVERQLGYQGHGEAVAARTPFECAYGFCWQLKVPLVVAAYKVYTMAEYEVIP